MKTQWLPLDQYKNQPMHNSLIFISSVISNDNTREDVLNKVVLDRCNWMQIFSKADHSLVAPLFYQKLIEKQLDQSCPVDFINALQAIYAANRERNQLYKQSLVRAIQLFNDAGITPILLKGSHTLMGVTANFSERFISDIDLLVSEKAIPLARQILLNDGFSQLIENQEVNPGTSPHHAIAMYNQARNIHIDLHRRPNFSTLYPELVDLCFSKDNLCFRSGDGLHFYHNHIWQLLLYNQIHHYHGWLNRTGMPDLRQLAEQSLLFSMLEDGECLLLQANIERILGDDADIAYLQFLLLSWLFNTQLPSRLIPSENSTAVMEPLQVLLEMPRALGKRKLKSIASILTYAKKQITKAKWRKNRLTNYQWYFSLPGKIRTAVRQNATIKPW